MNESVWSNVNYNFMLIPDCKYHNIEKCYVMRLIVGVPLCPLQTTIQEMLLLVA